MWTLAVKTIGAALDIDFGWEFMSDEFISIDMRW